MNNTTTEQVEEITNKLWNKWKVEDNGHHFLTKDLFMLALQDNDLKTFFSTSSPDTGKGLEEAAEEYARGMMGIDERCKFENWEHADKYMFSCLEKAYKAGSKFKDESVKVDTVEGDQIEAIYDAFANWYMDDGSYDTFLKSEAWKAIKLWQAGQSGKVDTGSEGVEPEPESLFGGILFSKHLHIDESNDMYLKFEDAVTALSEWYKKNKG